MPGNVNIPICKIDIIQNFLDQVEINFYDKLQQMAMEQGLFPKYVPTLAPFDKRKEEKKALSGWMYCKGMTSTRKSDILIVHGLRSSLSCLVKINKRTHHGAAYLLVHRAVRRMMRSTVQAQRR